MTSTTVRMPIRMSIREREYGGQASFGKQLLKWVLAYCSLGSACSLLNDKLFKCFQ